MHSYHELLQSHALNDLTTRAKSGIITYGSVWIILAFSYQLHDTHPTFFYLNTGYSLQVFFFLELPTLFYYKKSVTPKITLMNQWLVMKHINSSCTLGDYDRMDNF